MTTHTIAELKKLHTELFGSVQPLLKITDNSQVKKASPKQAKYIRNRIDIFLSLLIESSATVSLLDDYSWLGETLYKWQLIYKSLFDKDIQLQLNIPEKAMLKPSVDTNAVMSDEEVRDRIRVFAERNFFYRIREYHRESKFSDQVGDWRNGEVYFSWEVTNGSIRFDKSIASSTYYIFENIWLTELKELVSYFKWLEQREYVFNGRSTHKEDYQSTCDQLRRMLIDKERKVDRSGFLETKAYIENRYLSGGEFDEDKAFARQLIEKKASRICERIVEKGGKVDDNLDNWLDAKAYSKLFYENIIPAVIDSKRESILAILKAFQFTTTVADKMHVIDVFEVVLAIYYLDPDIILSFWNDSSRNDLEIYSALRSFVIVEKEPRWVNKGKEIGLDLYRLNDRLWLRGMIFDSQYGILIKACKSKSDESILNELYAESRLVKEKATL